jgi:hypothetical protein
MNLKKVAFAGITAGILFLGTGCAGNTPENNHGNRTGERITNSFDTNTNRNSDNLWDSSDDGINRSYNRGSIWNNTYISPTPGYSGSYNNYNRSGFRTNNNNSFFATSKPSQRRNNVIRPSAGNNLTTSDVNRGTLNNYNR